MKRSIYPLYAPADESRVRPLLGALKRKGVSVRDAGAKADKADALLLFLSENVKGTGPVADAFFRLSAGRALVIPVDLDGSAPPQELQSALMARHSIQAQRYSAGELAALIQRSVQGKSRLPLILFLLAGAAALAVGGMILYKQLGTKPGSNETATAEPTVEATPAPTAAPTAVPTLEPQVGGIPVGVTQVAEIVYVGDAFRYYTLNDGYRLSGNEDESRGYKDLAYESWERDGLRFYSTEDGHPFPRGETGDLSYLQLLPNLMYLTLVNVKAELPDLSGLEHLKGVNIVNCDIPDIRGLGGSAIYWLTYEGDTVRDFSPLNDCRNFNEAHLSLWDGAEAVDFTTFHPAKLRELSLNGQVTALGDLSGCTRLTRVEMDSALLTDLASLGRIPNLSSLRLRNLHRLRSLDGAAGLKNLWSLYLDACERLEDISAIAGCGNLERIRIDCNGEAGALRDVSALGKLPWLKSITLSCGSVKSLDFLKELPTKTDLELTVGIAPDGDYSGLSAVDSYDTLCIDADRRFSAIAPHLADKRVDNLVIWSAEQVDLSLLPPVRRSLSLGNCLNRDLTGIGKLPLNSLTITDCPYFTSFDGIENLPNARKMGARLTVENCPRLHDWSWIEHTNPADTSTVRTVLDALELRAVLTLPDFSAFTCRDIKLGYLPADVLPDLGCLSVLDPATGYNLRFVGMDQLTDLSPLFPLHGTVLEVPPQLGEQARGLVNDGRFRECRIVYPEGGWEQSEIRVRLMSLDELDTLPPSILRHVKDIAIFGDVLADRETMDWWDDWSDQRNGMPATVLVDKETGEETRIRQAGTLLADLSKLSALTGLEELTLRYQPLTSLAGMEGMEQLRGLQIKYCPKLTDISAAFTLQGLLVIDFDACPVASLQGVQNLYDLEELEMNNTKITSLEGIEGLTHLMKLRIAGTDVKDFSSLGQVDFSYAVAREGGAELTLSVHNAHRLPEGAFAALSQVPAFRQLEVNHCPVRLWLDYVMDKPVKELFCDNSGMSQAQFDAFLAAHPELERISVCDNGKITDVSRLLDLQHLQEVWLSKAMQKAVASLGDGYGFELHLD